MAGLEANLKSDGNSTTSGKEKPRSSALPLIMVAIVAGGLPLLWANRSLLPTPDPWKASTSDSSKPDRILPPTITLASPPTSPSPMAPKTPTDSETQAAARPVAPGKSGSSSPASIPSAADNAATTTKSESTSADTPKKVAKAPRVKTAGKPRPCTEATVALGLCDPKRTIK